SDTSRPVRAASMAPTMSSVASTRWPAMSRISHPAQAVGGSQLSDATRSTNISPVWSASKASNRSLLAGLRKSHVGSPFTCLDNTGTVRTVVMGGEPVVLGAACGHSNRPGARFCDTCGAPLAAPAAGGQTSTGPVLPAIIGGRYTPSRLLGEGVRKNVYLARDERL